MARKPDLAVRERILQKAEHVIHLKGYNHACLDEIADACGMTKGNLIHHYGSKSELALAVLDFKIKEFQSRKVEPVCAQAVPEDAVAEMFAAAERVFDGNGCKAGCFVGNIALEMSDLDETFRLRVAGFFDEWAAGLSACLERCKSKGYFRNELDAKAVAESIVAMYEGAMMLARSRRDATVFSRVGKTAKQLLVQYKVV
ncbi:MAG: TetR/AcrR family transcriptional regulator [Elusimicrobiota bacterium]|nr:MAG: TetR/AcrR family transcriptional regulator [Elusimicrobiota bacterium]